MTFTVRICFVCLLLLVAAGCAAHHTTASAPDYGIRPCPPAATEHLLSTDALQCWFSARHGRWRTLSHESHYAVLVVNVEAVRVDDAAVIARRFVAGERHSFSEILVYVQNESPRDTDIIRRIRWTVESGFEILDFVPPPREPHVLGVGSPSTAEPSVASKRDKRINTTGAPRRYQAGERPRGAKNAQSHEHADGIEGLDTKQHRLPECAGLESGRASTRGGNEP